ncbi:MAG: hypothetical protein ABIY50_11265 [Ignavibacteria bacterium]
MNEEIKTIFKYNAFVINKNLEDISQDESIMTPPDGGSSINWILGHIVLTRDVIHEMFGIKKMCEEDFEKLYARGSSTIRKEDAQDISSLLKIYNDSQEKIMKALEESDIRADEEKMNNIPGLSFHEAYHAGQMGVLRRVIGKKGVIQ